MRTMEVLSLFTKLIEKVKAKPPYLWSSSLKTVYSAYSGHQTWSNHRSWLTSWQSITPTICNTFTWCFVNQSFANTSLSTNLGRINCINSQQRKASQYHRSKIPHQVTCRHDLRGFLSLAVKLIWTCVRLPLMEAVGVSLSTAQFSSAQCVRGHATLEMKTRGENNKLIRRSILAAHSPQVTLVLWTEKEVPVKTPLPSSDRNTLTLTLSQCYVQVCLSMCYK